VTKVVGEVAGATLNKLGVKNIGTVSLEGKGFESIWNTAKTAIHDAASAGKDLFSMDTLSASNLVSSQAAVSPDGGVFDVPGVVETPVPEGTLGDAVEGFRAAQEVSAPAVDYSTFDPATGGTFVDAATTQAAATTQPSLLSRAGSSIVSRTKEAIVGAPEQFVKTGVASLATLPRDAALAAIQGPPEVTYDVRQSAVPDIGFAGIGQEYAQPAFDPISYFDQNQTAIAQSPFGFNARIYNDATYARNMQSYGFQTPMYGMA